VTHALLPTTVVGSYPQPSWLIDRERLGAGVPRLRAPEIWRVPEPYLEEAQDASPGDREAVQPLRLEREDDVTTIPRVLHEHINSAFPAHVCLVATVLPNGYAQVTPRGSTMVFDDEHLALWERGKGSTNANLRDGSKVTVFLRKPPLRESGLLPKGGIARFYGIAAIHRSGAAYEEVWRRLVQPEKDRDPDKKGFAVMIRVERAEDLDGAPLRLD
jgi:hypothetical protein